ncbi:MAG TPA: HIT family protein [Lachnospiraceae bacterium]|nr:HIT family protein [Lachnospiraceae bacterium]
MKDDCIFCKLANGVFETNKIYEDNDFTVILDAGPATKGHALIIPKEHYANIYELPEDIAGRALVLAKKLAAHMTDKLHCDGFNIVQNNGEAAGQTVFHFHIHLIPRFKGDGAMIQWKPGKPTDEEQKELCMLLAMD